MKGYRLEGVSQSYAGREVLRVTQLEVPAGRTLAILGPSGAGKSTLLRLLAMLERPDRGRITLDGVPLENPPLRLRRSVTMLFQRPLLLNLSVRGNVAYGLRLRGAPTGAVVEQALERVGMAHLAGARARTLSGGEAQRVALARALVLRTSVLLLDEPTANLDPGNVALIEEILQELRSGPTTLIVVTHHLFQARRLADDGALLIGGELVEHGPIERLFDAPQEARTEAFVQGRMVY